MKISFKIILIICSITVISGCRSKKGAKPIDINQQIINNYWTSQFDFDYLELRGKASIESGGKTNNVSMHFRMKKDSIVWGKFSLLGFEIARFLVTPDSFYLRDNMNSQYMKYSNRFLKEFIGFNPEVGQIQNLLLGNAPFGEDLYKLQTNNVSLEAREGIATNNLELNKNFRTLVSRITTPDTTQNAEIQYSEYNVLNDKLMPKNVNINVNNQNQKLGVVLNYQIVNTNTISTFPFSIPGGFKRL